MGPRPSLPVALTALATLLATACVVTGARSNPELQIHPSGGLQDSGLPPMRYKFTSFATPFPVEAAEFCVKYFGAQLLTDPSDFLVHKNLPPEATVTGLRFKYKDNPQYGSFQKELRFTDVYFVNDPTKPSGNLSVTKYNSYLHETHSFELQESWDWYQDWHLCFYTEDLDLVLYRLMLDNVPVVTRSSYSFYVEVPTGITFQFIGRKMSLIWTELFAFCRVTTGEATPQQLQIADMPAELPPLPELLAPSHHSFFSNQAVEAQKFLTDFTSGHSVDLAPLWKETHRYSDGRCAMLAWVEFQEFQVHFVEQYRKYQGKELTTKDVEEHLSSLHGNMERKDAFMDNHLGFVVDSIDPFVLRLQQQNQQYLLEGSSLFIQLPGGIIFHIVEQPSSRGTSETF
mmetsp:Transcript_19191/g.53515  ORF Transcript_19191/g.53515 Transcript_19191/m.53515 type:complete len:400 (-) Transcript_19191:1529-2728(-)|eukprot:CAMPEP_0117659506 /NCGR_PEP_ID=MMETSP0804-20121206/6471_1 /TAXON_ID=1074897 /ORGANISM="Tetraselmis astigmatica, Strain CCMP880" /LENGTH=399 /DNA_ID=CAMNT_0005466173 /DNA_START=86 /DNA_END=1285 /DNA_ORIENTATION=+